MNAASKSLSSSTTEAPRPSDAVLQLLNHHNLRSIDLHHHISPYCTSSPSNPTKRHIPSPAPAAQSDPLPSLQFWPSRISPQKSIQLTRSLFSTTQNIICHGLLTFEVFLPVIEQQHSYLPSIIGVYNPRSRIDEILHRESASGRYTTVCIPSRSKYQQAVLLSNACPTPLPLHDLNNPLRRTGHLSTLEKTSVGTRET